MVRPSEAERPGGLISLTTGRTPEPLNPGLHSVRSQPPGTHPRGALTAPVFWLDPGHIQSQAVHDPFRPPPFRLPHPQPPVSTGSINTVQGWRLCVSAFSGAPGSRAHSRRARRRRARCHTGVRSRHRRHLLLRVSFVCPGE